MSKSKYFNAFYFLVFATCVSSTIAAELSNNEATNEETIVVPQTPNYQIMMELNHPAPAPIRHDMCDSRYHTNSRKYDCPRDCQECRHEAGENELSMGACCCGFFCCPILWSAACCHMWLHEEPGEASETAYQNITPCCWSCIYAEQLCQNK